MKKLIVPLHVVNNLTTFLHQTYPTLTHKQRSKLFSVLVMLWFYIYQEWSSKSRYAAANFNSDVHNLIYVNINRKNLSKYNIMVCRNYLQYPDLIKILHKCKLVESTKSYSSGKFPKSYRPHQNLDYTQTKFVDLDIDKLLKSIKSQDQLIKENPKYQQLIKNMYGLQIQLEPYFANIDSLIDQVYAYDNQGNEKIMTHKLAYEYKIKAIKINLGIHFFSVAKTGRVYSSISNLPKLALPYSLLFNQPIVEIDAANCQPLLLASLIDHPKYQQDCQTGQFYDVVAQSLDMSRQQFKKLSYAQIFFNNRHITKDIATKLDSVYPGLSQQINKHKVKSNKAADKLTAANQQNQLLWWKLQHAEANIFIQTALDQLAPVLTRHDSIICTHAMAQDIQQDLQDRFKQFNLIAQLTIESF